MGNEIKMNESCKHISLGGLANCYEGVSEYLYETLCRIAGEVEHEQKQLGNYVSSMSERAADFEGSHDLNEHNQMMISQNWDRFTPGEQMDINAAIKKEEEQYA